MPIYDYKCDGCGCRFELSHAMSADPVKVCPECGVEKVRKMLTTGGVIGERHGAAAGPPPPMMPSCATGGCGDGGGMCGLS